MKSSSPKSDSIPHRGGEMNSALGWDYLSSPKRLANIETCTPPLGPASPKMYRAWRFFFLWGRVAARGCEWCPARCVGCHCATPRRHRTLKRKNRLTLVICSFQLQSLPQSPAARPCASVRWRRCHTRAEAIKSRDSRPLHETENAEYPS